MVEKAFGARRVYKQQRVNRTSVPLIARICFTTRMTVIITKITFGICESEIQNTLHHTCFAYGIYTCQPQVDLKTRAKENTRGVVNPTTETVHRRPLRFDVFGLS